MIFSNNKSVLLAILVCFNSTAWSAITINFGNSVDTSVVNLQAVGLMVCGFGMTAAGSAVFYSILKNNSKEPKEVPFNKKDYLLVRAIKATGRLILGTTKVAVASGLAVGGVALIITSPYLVEWFHDQVQQARRQGINNWF